jgi:hypothetical protein
MLTARQQSADLRLHSRISDLWMDTTYFPYLNERLSLVL